MTIRTAVACLAVAAITGTSAGVSPTVSADDYPTIEKFGTEQIYTDDGIVQGWTISDLQPSTDVINHAVVGELWEATATDRAIQGDAVPVPYRFSARTPGGQDYELIRMVSSPPQISWSTIPAGESATGKLYFDVTGEKPDGVVYRTVMQDLLIWVR